MQLAILLAAGVLAVAAVAAAEPLVLALDARTDFRILAAADASPAEQHAAAELAAYLGKMSGATFPVETGNGQDAARAIVLRFDPTFGGEEYRLQADAARAVLTVTGGRPRGVLYGVYALLEDHLGCRWYTRDCEKVPRRDPLAIPADLDRRFKPRLEYREPFWTEAFDGDWAARNRMNSANAHLTEKHGGKVVYGTFVHTFEKILHPKDHFEKHPEYFSMVKGRRLKEHTQLCLTHPEVLRAAIERVREWIAKNPNATLFSVSQNDWYNPCECPECKKVDDEEGSHAGTLIRFVNRVAEAIGKDHPNVAIDTLAYQYTRKPPRHVKPLPNVIVRLCSIECCFSHPLDGCPEKSNTSFMEDLRGWNRLTHRLYVWDYTTNFRHYLLPNPNLDVLDKNVRTFADHGVVGIFEQGNYSKGGGGELGELRSWVLAKLLWDPSRDGDELIREFVAGAFGPAATKVQAFVDLQREAIRRSGEHVRIFDDVKREYLAPETLRACDRLLEEAEDLANAGGDAALTKRVRRLRMPIWYARAAQAVEPIETLKPAVRRLLEVAREQKVTHFHEWTGIEHDIGRFELFLASRPVTYAQGAWVGEERQFGLYREGELVALVADAKAEDGVAARQAGRTTEWSIQWRFGRPEGAAPGLYRLRVRIRVEKQGDEGPAFHVGAYDANAKASLGEIRLQAKDVPHDEYRWYDVCDLELREGRYAYVAPDDNERNVTAIYVDRFELRPSGLSKE